MQVAFHKDKPSNKKCAEILKEQIKLCLKIDNENKLNKANPSHLTLAEEENPY